MCSSDLAELRQAQAAGLDGQEVIETATTKYVIHAHPDQSLDSVMAKLGARNFSRLPVVSREDPTRLLGIITVEDIMNTVGNSLDAAETGGENGKERKSGG